MTRVQAKKSGRIVSTIPKGKAENLRDPDGHHLSWHVESRNRLSARPEGLVPDTDRKTTVIQHNPAADQYTVAIPTGLAHAMHMLGADLAWEFESGRYIIDIENRGKSDE